MTGKISGTAFIIFLLMGSFMSRAESLLLTVQTDLIDNDTIRIDVPTLSSIHYIYSNDSVREQFFFPYTLKYKHPFVSIDDFDPFLPPEYAIIKRPGNNNLLIFIVLVNVMFLIAVIRISNERKLAGFMSSLYSGVSALKFFGDRATVFNRVNMQLFLVEVIIISMGLTLYTESDSFIVENSYLRFGILFPCISMMILSKIGISYFLGHLFEIKNLPEVTSNFTIGYNFIGILFILPIFLIVYLNGGVDARILPLFVLFTVLLLVCIRVFRTFQLLNVTFPYPKVYLLLYLCAVELVPWLILLKLSSG